MPLIASGIVIVDIDAGLTLAERKEYAAAQQAQLVEDLCPAWDIEPLHVRAADPSDLPRPGEIQVQLMNKPTLDGALGYHDSMPDGTPIAYVFVGLAKQFGDEWTSVSSHEVCEFTVDPYLRRAVQMEDGFWDVEVCDRVEQESYVKSGITLSNFNTPACFEPPTFREGIRYDFLGLSTKPNEVRPGGYAQHFDTAKGWVQLTNGHMSDYRVELRALAMSRGARRAIATPRPSWIRRLFGL